METEKNVNNNNFPPNINPQTFSLIGVAVSAVLVGDLNVNEQNSLGNWFELVGQYMLTHAAQQQLIEGRIENSNLNINSKKYKSGAGGPFTDNETGKSNQTQRQEVDFLLDRVKKIEEELKRLKSSI